VIDHRFDIPSADDLRERGSLKWSEYPREIGAFIAEMDFGTAPPVQRAIAAAVERNAFGYLPSYLADELRDACSAWQRERYGWAVDPSDVHPVSDILTILELTIRHFSAPGSKIIVPTPAYMPFLTIPAEWDREIVEVPLLQGELGWQLDLDGVDAAFADGAGLLVLCNPNNPTGRVFTRDELLALSAVVDRHGARVFADEVHAPLIYPGAGHVPYASLSATTAGHTITATSAAKAWNLPGLKCAQAIIGNPADAETWAERCPRAEDGPSTLGVIANTAAFTTGGRWLEDVLGYLDGNRLALRDALAELIPEVAFSAPQATYLGWLDCRGLDLGDAPSEFFHRHAGVATTNGMLCGAVGAGHLRFNFALPRPLLREAVRQMADALAQR
jgi:cystathionine beta-lyase